MTGLIDNAVAVIVDRMGGLLWTERKLVIKAVMAHDCMRLIKLREDAPSRPQPVAVFPTEGEPGGTWAEWKKLPVTEYQGKRAHAIEFDDGTVFDMQNGWRERCPERGWRRIVDQRVDGTGWAEAAFVDDVDPAQRAPYSPITHARYGIYV